MLASLQAQYIAHDHLEVDAVRQALVDLRPNSHPAPNFSP